SRDQIDDVFGKEVVGFHNSLPSTSFEPVFVEDPLPEASQATEQAFMDMFSRFANTVRCMSQGFGEQNSALKEIIKFLDYFAYHDPKLKARLCKIVLNLKENSELQMASMQRVIDTLRLIPETMKSNTNFLHKKIIVVSKNNLDNCKVLEHKIEIVEKH
ncbi:hypothetical protein Dimus_007902, partial [Dionaea muscipula]